MAFGLRRSRHLSEPVTEKFSDDMENDLVYCGASAMQGWRTSQEDRHFCILNYDKNTSLFGVFDGHGGFEVAQYAAEELPKMIKNHWYANGYYRRALMQAFVDFDERLKYGEALRRMKKIRLKNARREEIDAVDHENIEILLQTEKAGFLSGTTATVALLIGKRLFVASVGDSRGVFAKRGTEAISMSTDHKPENLVERIRIVKARGRVGVDGRISHDLNMSRSLGDHRYKQNRRLPVERQIVIGVPDVTFRILEPENGDYFVLGSDGIWNSLSSQVVVNFVSRRIKNPGIRLSSICEQLMDLCFTPQRLYADDGFDNMTFIIVKHKCEENELKFKREETVNTAQMVFEALSLD